MHLVASKQFSVLETLERLFHRPIDFVHAHPGVPRLLFGGAAS
jgi:hypothetical protein